MGPRVKDSVDRTSSRMWALADRLRTRGLSFERVSREYLTALAAFVLLKHADVQEREDEAIAGFDATPYSPQLPQQVSWPFIASIPADELAHVLAETAWPLLSALPSTELCAPLRQIPAVVSTTNVSNEILVAGRDLVAEVWTDYAGRDRLATELEDSLQLMIDRTRYSGEFATPPSIADLVVDLAAPRAGERVYDPCFGAGGLLVRAARRIVREGMTLSSQDWGQLQFNSIFGVEIQPHLSLIAAARVILAGISFPKLETGDALERNGIGEHGNEGFDCIMANPPFGLRVSEMRAAGFRIRSTSGENLFLQHILRCLRPGGRAVVAVPESLLFRSGQDTKLRELLLKEYRVDAVLSLPDDAFSPYTSVKTSLLLVSRQMPLETVCFVGQGILGRVLNDSKADELRSDLIKTIDRRRKGASFFRDENGERQPFPLNTETSTLLKGGPDVNGRLAMIRLEPVDNLAKRNWELVVKSTGESELDLFLERVTEASPASEIRRLGEVAEVFAGVQYDKNSLQDYSWEPSPELIPFIRVQEITRPVTRQGVDGDLRGLPEVRIPPVRLVGPRVARLKDKQRLRTGDLLITASGTIGKLAIVGEAVAGSVPAQSILVIRPKTEIHSPVLLRLLQSANYQLWIHGHVTGAPIRHLSPRVLRDLPVVVFDNRTQSLLSRDLAEGANDETILELLSRSAGQSHWITQLLNNNTLAQLQLLVGSERKAELWPLVDRWLDESTRLRERMQSDSESDPFARWLLWWTDSVAGVREKKDIPDSMSRFAALQSWRNEFVHGGLSWLYPARSRVRIFKRATRPGIDELDTDVIGDALSGWLRAAWTTKIDEKMAKVSQDRVERLSSLPLVLAQAEMAALLGLVSFTASAEPSLLDAGQKHEIKIRLRNESPLALRKVFVRAQEHGLPSNPQTERYVLGALLLDNNLFPAAARSISPEDFTVDANRHIYVSMLKIVNNGRPIDIISLAEQLDSDRLLQAAGDIAYISSLLDGVDDHPRLDARLQNLRDTTRFREEFSPIHGEGGTSSLSAGADLSFPLIIPASPPRQITIDLEWLAQRLNDEPVNGSIQVGIEIRAATTTGSTLDFGKSPYVVGTPIDRPSMFYGRTDILGQIARGLRTEGPASVILLEGNRRTGKTSILKHVLKSPEMCEWVRVYCSFQSTEGGRNVPGVPTGEVFYSIARELIMAIHESGNACNIPGVGILDSALSRVELRHLLLTKLHPIFEGSAPFEHLLVIIEAAIEAVSPKRILLMLDEFDKLQEGIDNKITSPQLPENIRYIFHTYSQLSGILTGSRRIKRLRDEYWSALFGIGSVVSVSALDEHAARSLVTQPVEGRLVFAPAAVDQVLHLTAGQPFLIQSLCHRVFELCAGSNERNVTTSTVDSAAERMVADNEHFRTLWDYIRSDRRRYIVCLVDRLHGGSNRITLAFLTEKLEQEGISYKDNLGLAHDLDELRELEVIQLGEEQFEPTYRITIPLLSLWIHKNVDGAVHRLGALQEEG